MKTFEKLKRKIFEDTGIKACNFRRTRVGYWQVSRGAFLWVADVMDGETYCGDIGSRYTATELTKRKYKLITYTKDFDTEIFPEEREENNA